MRLTINAYPGRWIEVLEVGRRKSVLLLIVEDRTSPELYVGPFSVLLIHTDLFALL